MGAWIETIFALLCGDKECVAPYVGAWIETSVFDKYDLTGFGRTLRGCVD